MCSYKVLFHLLILLHVIPLLDIVSRLSAEPVQVNGDAGGIKGLGCDGEGGTGMGVSCLGGCPDAEEPGLGLTDPKQKASSDAQEAKQLASSAQILAADAAALKEKTELADKAAQCVRSAEATVEQLQKDAKAANAAVVAATASLEYTLATADAAKWAARETESQLNQMKTLAEQIAIKVANTRRVTDKALAQLDEHKQLVEVAKMRVANATRRVADAQADFDNTKEAAIRATAQRALPQHRSIVVAPNINRTGYFLHI